MNKEEHKKRGQLRITFMILFILISCVPIFGLGTVSLLSIKDAYTKNISELENQALINASETTSLFFNTIIDTLGTNFDSLDVKNLEVATSSWQQMYAKKFVEDNNALLEVSFLNREGKEIAKYSKINKSTNLLYLQNLDLVKNAFNGNVTISTIHRTLAGEAVTIAVPSVINGQGYTVVLAEVSLSSLTSALEKIKLGKTGYAKLFDIQGTLLTSSSTTSATNFLEWQRLHQVLGGGKYTGILAEDRYVSPITSLPVIGSGISIPKIGMAIFVEWPIREADAIIEQFRNTVLFAIFFSILVVLLVAYLFANRLVLPIKRLQEAAHQIETGNFDKQVTIVTNNELEDLAESFNAMSLGLKRLEELKNEFVYIAAHELRAPVTAIKGYLELVFEGQAGVISPEMDHLLSPVRKSNDRLVNLVNNLLKVAKGEANKIEITLSPANITTAVNAILEEIKPLADTRKMKVVYNQSENVPLVNVDIGSFKEIMMNFASNAVKYGNDGGSITVAHEITSDMVITHIADNGKGMSEDDQKHLFQKFFRASDVKKTSIEGTGLGLFITKELVEKMNGTLAVSSELGKGTTFSVGFKKA